MRNVFPRNEDRVQILAFLKGAPVQSAPNEPPSCTAVFYMPSPPRLVLSIDSAAVWYDTAGALVAQIATGHARPSSVLLINAIMVMLGQPAMQLAREVDNLGTADVPTVRYFFDGNLVECGAPFVLTGPIGVRAWRASNQ